ncbi:hypothetical protein H3H36_03555 [Duganella sp. FT3S]|uniref:Uncharacterized protein n=1 Tax=Rugamonas fusca TaxID=2758568 RepID=A0A7W2EEN2_9BURK|nr:hypothetical protein [Rugamonas fusca]MBA5604436.1 hypothetical protein [Rugamonas fusca]
MTATTAPSQLPNISIDDLRILSTQPGTLQVTIKKVNGYFMPFVQFAPPVGHTILHGVITQGSDVVATVDLAEALTAVEQIIGSKHNIVMPESTGTPILH